MKNYEKKSFFTTFALFFIPLFVLFSVVLYMYYNEQKEEMKTNILYKMKSYTYDFKGNSFSIDVVQRDGAQKVFKLYNIDNEIFSYFEIPTKSLYLLKVLYDTKKYQNEASLLVIKMLMIGSLSLFVIFFISIGFAFYSLKPMRESMGMLENFLKDLIHDLNTPATSILLNAKLLRRRGDFDEIERIEICAKGIASLYKNLELMTPSKMPNDEIVKLDFLINQKIEILKKSILI